MEQNLNHYKIFFEVAKTGNISKAAEILYISQPAVSKSITKLEQSLGHTLFIRSKRGVKLTEEGTTLYTYLKQAFESIETAEKALQHASELGMGQLRIGVSTSLCKHILLSYLQDFIRENPHVKITIECNPTFETIQLLKQDKIDIGLICDTPLDKGYHFTPLRSIQDTFVTTQTYLDNLQVREGELSDHTHTSLIEVDDSSPTPDNSDADSVNTIESATQPVPSAIPMTGLLFFADNRNDTFSGIELSPQEILEKCNLMLLDKENISRIFIDEYLKTHQIHPGQILEINNMDLLIDFAAIGMGVACVVREFVTSYLDSGQVIELPMDFDIPKRMIGFVYAEHNLSTTAKKFLDYCIA
ncbi:MAG TPA: LysR family transcriptional regulator [Lachnospiraceae bacterium]|nr:LysR family transcriptional regulator [Lachnospiraceae bacterium]